MRGVPFAGSKRCLWTHPDPKTNGGVEFGKGTDMVVAAICATGMAVTEIVRESRDIGRWVIGMCRQRNAVA